MPATKKKSQTKASKASIKPKQPVVLSARNVSYMEVVGHWRIEFSDHRGTIAKRRLIVDGISLDTWPDEGFVSNAKFRLLGYKDEEGLAWEDKEHLIATQDTEATYEAAE